MVENLVLYKNYLISLNRDVIFYIENNILMTCNISTVRKYNLNKYFNINICNNEVNIYNKIFNIGTKNNDHNNFKKSKIKIIEYKLIKYFKEFFYENKLKMKIIGRGWKIVKYNYQILIKLGYSHMIFVNIYPVIKYKMKKKKKKYYLFYGVLNNELSKELNKIKLMRIPNIYTRKGIFYNKLYF